MGKVFKMNGKETAFTEVYDRIQSGQYENGYAKFSEDLHAAYGLSDHPKRGMLFIMAFHRGVSTGYVGILKEYDELANLLI